MRAMFTVTASLLICVGLFGCDRNHQAQAPAATTVAAVAPVCNCPQQAATATPVMIARRHRHHHQAWNEHESSSYSESYGPESENSYSQSSSDTGQYDAAAENNPPADETHADAAAWVDGYGRSHYASASASDDTNPALLTAEENRHRHAPWHAYDSDCDRAK